MGSIAAVATIISALCDMFGILKPFLLPLTESPIAWMLVRSAPERSRTFVDLLSDDDPRKRQVARRILCRVGAPVVPLLIDAVADMANGTLREEASHTLPRIGLPAIRPMIVARYVNHEKQNRMAFLLLGEALSHVEKSQAVMNHLLELLVSTESDWQIKRGSAFTLGAIRSRQAIEPLCQTLSTGDSERPEVRREVAWALGEIGDATVRSYLVRSLCDDPDWEVRVAAAEALGKVRGTDAVHPLIAALEDDRRVVEKAVTALGLIADDSAIGPLISTLQHKSPKVREAIAQALGEIGSVRAIPALLQRIEEDLDENVRYFAKEALIAIDTGEAVAQLEEAPSRVLKEPIQDRLSLILGARERIKKDMERRRSGNDGFSTRY